MGDFVSLAIDLGSTFGYAIGRNGTIFESGEVILSAGVGKTHPGHRWLRFQKWLASYANVDEILYEEVQAFRSSQASMVYGALRSQLQIFTLAHGIRMCTLTPGQIKSDFTGNGNAPKEMMCNVAMNLGWKHGLRDTRNLNNEADAIALFWCVYTRRDIQPKFLSTVVDPSQLDAQQSFAVT